LEIGGSNVGFGFGFLQKGLTAPERGRLGRIKTRQKNEKSIKFAISCAIVRKSFLPIDN
jgi:hypothetical protein